MSTPIAKHSDGSNCYTKGCSRRGGHQPLSLASSLAAPTALEVQARDEWVKSEEGKQKNAAVLIADGFKEDITDVMEDVSMYPYDGPEDFRDRFRWNSTETVALMERMSDAAKNPVVADLFTRERDRLVDEVNRRETDRGRKYSMDGTMHIQASLYELALITAADKKANDPQRYKVAYDSHSENGDIFGYAPTLLEASNLSKEFLDIIGVPGYGEPDVVVENESTGFKSTHPYWVAVEVNRLSVPTAYTYR